MISAARNQRGHKDNREWLCRSAIRMLVPLLVVAITVRAPPLIAQAVIKGAGAMASGRGTGRALEQQPYFVENCGQWRSPALFVTRHSLLTARFESDAVELTQLKPGVVASV